MNLKRALPILWLPLIGVWTFIFAIQSNASSKDLEGVVPIITYVIVSFLFVLQLQLLISNKREGLLVKVGTIYAAYLYLTVSSITIFSNLLFNFDNELSIIIIVLSLICNTITAEIMSYSNREIVKKKEKWTNTTLEIEKRQRKISEDNSQDRLLSLENREEWKKYLQQASIDYSDNSEIIDELNRIKDIVEFSSYFRTKLSEEALSKLKSNSDANQNLAILKDIK